MIYGFNFNQVSNKAEYMRKWNAYQYFEKNSLRIFIYFIVTISIFKLLLVSSNEIVSTQNDSVNYLRQSQEYIGSLGMPPGYSYWLAFSRVLGLPQRISIEILYLSSATLIGIIFFKNYGRALGFLLFTTFAFLPTTFFLFDNALSDGFFGCLTIVSIALSYSILLNVKNYQHCIDPKIYPLAISLGIMMITRNEDILIIFWIFWLIVTYFFALRPFLGFKYSIIKSIKYITILIVFSNLLPIGVSYYHSFSEGVYARTIATLPSHLALLKNLSSIDTGQPSINRVPITKYQREISYKASPTLASIKSIVEDPANMYQLASQKAGFREGEVGAGWAWHVINDAAIQVLKEKTLYELNLFYLKANDELNMEFSRGGIKKSFVIHPMLSGNLTGFFNRLPYSIHNVLMGIFSTYSYTPYSNFESLLFDSACLRRAYLNEIHSNGLSEGIAWNSAANIQYVIQEKIRLNFENLGKTIFLLIIITLFFIFGFNKIVINDKNKIDFKYIITIIFIGGLLLQRICFYTLIDAVGWDVEIRYLNSALIMLIIFSAAILSFISNDVKNIFMYFFKSI
jgi:hypothetical protein